MNSELKFKDIRPYRDFELKQTLDSLLKDPKFKHALEQVKSKDEVDEIYRVLPTASSIDEFQKDYIITLIGVIEKKTIESLTISGLENLDKNKKYFFMGNHRDIILDSALLNKLLFDKGFETTEIGLGDNLLVFPWIENIVRINKGFIVRRSLKGKEMLKGSILLSEYIHQNIKQNKSSIWLAQREGRTKDGNDITQPGLIKMLIMPNRKDPIECINSLNICPVTISYENEPCIDIKIKTTYYAQKNLTYKKNLQEDLRSMGKGILFDKGNIHIHINKPIEISKTPQNKAMPENQLVAQIAKYIDNKIYEGYKFFPKNYIAYDLYSKSDTFLKQGKYNEEQKAVFLKDLTHSISKFEIEDPLLSEIYIKLYAYPIINHLNPKSVEI